MWNGANDPMDYPEPSDGPTDDATCVKCGKYPYWPVKHGGGWLCGECAADHEHVPAPRGNSLRERLSHDEPRRLSRHVSLPLNQPIHMIPPEHQYE